MGRVFVGLFLDFYIATEVHAEADFHGDEGALFPHCRKRSGRGGRARYPSCVDEVRSCAMSWLEQRLSLARGEDPIWYTAGGRCALFVSVSGGESQMVGVNRQFIKTLQTLFTKGLFSNYSKRCL